MRLAFIKKDKIDTHILPNKIYGNYWIEEKDSQGHTHNLINIEAENNAWRINSNLDTQILMNNNYVEHTYLKENMVCVLTVKGNNDPIILYCLPYYDTTFISLTAPDNREFIIGNQKNCQICYHNEWIDKKQAKLSYQNGIWSIESLSNKCGTYVNQLRVTQTNLKNGDIIFIMGLKIIILGNNIVINNPNQALEYRMDAFAPTLPYKYYSLDTVDKEEDIELFSEEDYFWPAPRFKNVMGKTEIEIEGPPMAQNQKESPMIYTIGPMVTMGMASLAMLLPTLSNVLDKKQDLSTAFPSLMMSGSMLLSTLLWPFLRTRYERRKMKSQEKIRIKKYRKYLENKKNEITLAIQSERNTIAENLVDLAECQRIIEEKKQRLWERKIEQEDFLNLRLGVGPQGSNVVLKYPNEKFTVEEDKLLDEMHTMIHAFDKTDDVPYSNNFAQNNITTVLGIEEVTTKFMAGLILQMITFHTYNNLKIIILTNSEKEYRWDYLKTSNYNWNNDKQYRYFATNLDEANQVDVMLQEIWLQRSQNEDNKDKTYHDFPTYYMIITDDFNSYRNLQIIKSILNSPKNYGFSILINQNRMFGLPPQCSCFINVNNKIKSSIFGNELVSNNQKEFMADIMDLDMKKYCRLTSNIHLQLESGSYTLPDSISFLEMYGVGKIEQLNILNRWKNNNPFLNLQAPVGINEAGELLKLDLHEKFHGPHGLIAGMTGSGKSEFIITYILSMAVNYHPDEVQFVLIDYKGGGLVGAFENRETGVVLPHLAGTITNLDTSEMNRALASIESELKRRQRIFNKARDILNSGTIDIYKYQRLYRDGKVKEPVSHLFIITDEFAELKAQQPEFMEQLISTARIGRSLGVHLILATQKPNGVVNDQIWSNSRFRVCLKVQEKTDSMDMIKRPDAASLKNVGRFYLQVGYNELFTLGQSAWCGEAYYGVERPNKKIATSVDFIDNTGYVIKSVNNKQEQKLEKHGEELTNIVNYLYQIGKEQNIHIPKLWLDKMPAVIYVSELLKKYNIKEEPFVLNPVIGEYDDPSNQAQHCLTLPLSKFGNAIICGMAGSGKENLLNTIIYSLITQHSTEEVNLYVMDFGGGTLKNFIQAPQVGDVILPDDNEKIENLFKMISRQIETRKKLLSDYNGDYFAYCKNSGKTIPQIIVIINGYDTFNDLYGNYNDTIAQLTRECLKYGIIFIIATTNINGLSFRIKQNFTQFLALQLADPSEYIGILDSFSPIYPSKIKGRGLIKLDNIYEFQSAYACEPDRLVEFTKNISKSLSEKIPTKASIIATLPKVVTPQILRKDLRDLTQIPIGIEKETLQVKICNLEKDNINLVLANQSRYLEPFLRGMISQISVLKRTEIYLFDGYQLEDVNYKNCNYYRKITSAIWDNLLQNAGDYKKTCIIIYGLDEFINANPQFNIDKLLKELKNRASFIILETNDRMKNYEYSDWYKKISNNMTGIWIGPGIYSQSLFKSTQSLPMSYNNVDEHYGFFMQGGNIEFLKLVEEKKDE